MEPVGSLTRSQRQTTGSCPHSDKCTPHILLHKVNFNSLISFHLYILLLSGFHLSGFPTQTLYARKEDTIPKKLSSLRCYSRYISLTLASLVLVTLETHAKLQLPHLETVSSIRNLRMGQDKMTGPNNTVQGVPCRNHKTYFLATHTVLTEAQISCPL
jgi:hypothetical protein